MSSVPRRSDPVIEADEKGVDRTLLRENLTLTVEERLQKLAAMLAFLSEWRGAAGRPKDLESIAQLEGILEEGGGGND